MKFLIVFVALFAYTFAAPNSAEIVKSDSDVQPDGYRFIVETSDGKKHEEQGVVKDLGKEHAAIVVHGSYEYKDDHTGEHIAVTYVADENGFQPQGAHIPQLPKIVVDPHH